MTKPKLNLHKSLLTLASLAVLGVGVTVAQRAQREPAAAPEDARQAPGSLVAGGSFARSNGASCAFEVGHRMAYDVTTKSQTELDMTPMMEEVEVGDSSARATVTTTKQSASRSWHVDLEAMAQATDGSTILAARIAARPTRVEGRRSLPPIEGLSDTFLVRVDPQCTIEDFARRATADETAALDQQQLLAGLGFVAPSDGESSYAGTTFDTLGRYYAQYRVGNDGAIHGRAMEYQAAFGQAQGGIAPRFKIEASGIEVQPAAGDWFAALRNERTVTLEVSGHDIGHVATAVAAQPSEFRGPLAAVDVRDGDWTWGILLGQAKAAKTATPEVNPALAGAPLRGAVEAYLAKAAETGSSLDAVPMLVEWLRSNPEGAGELVAQLRAGAFEDGSESGVFLALATAGTQEGSTALVDLVASPSDDVGHRLSAAHALTNVRMPNEAMVDAVIAATEEGLDASTRGSFAMSLGAFASRHADGSPELATRAREKIGEWLSDPADDTEAGGSLLAAGNAGHPELLPAIDPYFEDEDPQLRTKATHAMRHMPAEDAYPRLADSLDDEDATVRARAAESALAVSGKQGAKFPEAIVDRAVEGLDLNRPEREQRALLDLLGEAAKQGSEGAAAVLQQHFEDELESGAPDLNKLRALGQHTHNRWVAGS